MEKHQKDRDEQVLTLKTEYLNSLNDMIKIFDGKPFRDSGVQRPNRSLYDALMVARGIYGPITADPNQVQKKLQSVIAEHYELMVGSKKNVFQAIVARIELAKTVLYG